MSKLVSFVSLVSLLSACFGQGRPLEHGHFCRQSSECSGVLICRNNMCICQDNSHYLGNGQCSTAIITKAEGYDETCSLHSDCNEKLGLGCKRWKKCGCYPDNYWDGSRCQHSKQYGEPCTNSQECAGDLGCWEGNKCSCRSGQQLEGENTCLVLNPPPKFPGQTCASSLECLGQYTICTVGNICSCMNGYEWDVNLNDCKLPPEMKRQSEACSNDLECKGILYCLNNTCDCPGAGSRYDEAGDLCIGSGRTPRPNKAFGETCQVGKLECAFSLVCLDRKCTCLNGYEPDGNGKCQVKNVQRPKMVGDLCKHSLECYGNLWCRENRCACNENHEWDGTDCRDITTQAPKNFGDSCGTSFDCSAMLLCQNELCQCPSGMKFNAGTCKEEFSGIKLFGGSCTFDSECIGELACLNSICACSPGVSYFGFGICLPTLQQGYGGTCSNNSDCKDGFVCKNGGCTCQATAQYSESLEMCLEAAKP